MRPLNLCKIYVISQTGSGGESGTNCMLLGGGGGRGAGHLSAGEGLGYSAGERHESSKPEQEFISSVRLGQVDESGTNVM